MAISSIAQGLFRAPAIALMIASSSLLLSGCGGGSADSAKAQSTSTESTDNSGTDTGTDQPNTAPHSLSLSSQPGNATIYEGQSTTFTLGVSHNYPVTISWYKNGSKISGASGTSYTVAAASTGSAGSYSCSVTDGTLTVNCSNFSLVVNQIVRITQQPANQMVSAGENVSLSVTATGTGPLNYQWYFNSQAMSGKTTAQLNLSNVTADNNGNYYCIVRNGGSNATSSTAAVSVVAAAETGSAQISWSRPTTRADGSTLTAGDIAGYQLYYSSTSSGQLTPLTNLTAAELSVLVDDLIVGTHYFALTTTDINGLESAQTSRFSVTIN